MALPTVDQYLNALMHYRVRSLRANPELAACDLVMHGNGREPLKWNGAFALVVSLQNGSHRYALRLFRQDIGDLGDRYGAIEAFLAEHDLPFVVRPHFRAGLPEEGIFVAGGWYPYVWMPWAPGVSLKEWVVEHARQDDRNGLRALAQQWTEAILALHSAGGALGDVHAENANVGPDGRLYCIDPDGMYVPALEGREALSPGLGSYRHPRRSVGHFDSHIDDFPALVVLTSTLALAAEPSCARSDVGEADLLFTEEDLADPQASAVFQRLLSSSDAEVARLAAALRDACERPCSEMPCFAQLVDVKVAQERAFTELRAARDANDERGIQKAWGDGSLLDSYGPASAPAIRARVKLADERVRHHDELRACIVNRDNRGVIGAHQSLAQLDGIHMLDEEDVRQITLARRRMTALDRLHRAFSEGATATTNTWRPDLLTDCIELTARDRVRVSRALRSTTMPSLIDLGLAEKNALLLAMATDRHLLRRTPSSGSDPHSADALSALVRIEQGWLSTIAET